MKIRDEREKTKITEQQLQKLYEMQVLHSPYSKELYKKLSASFSYMELRNRIGDSSSANVRIKVEDPLKRGCYFIACRSFNISNEMQDFYLFTYRNERPTESSLTNRLARRKRNAARVAFMKLGLKFHNSLYDGDMIGNRTLGDISANIRLGWDTLAQFLVRYRISMSKVVMPGIKLAEDQRQKQQGKQITIYGQSNFNLGDWRQFLEYVTIDYIQEGVRRGLPCVLNTPKHEHRINGSRYFSYRLEAEEEKKTSGNFGKVNIARRMAANLGIHRFFSERVDFAKLEQSVKAGDVSRAQQTPR